jgi:hypothetical protein
MPRKGTYFIYCAAQQKVTEWVHLPDRNQEILFQCKDCGRFLKFPSGTSRGKLAKLFLEHQRQNEGATPIETQPTAPLIPDQIPPKPVGKWYERMFDALNN